MEMHIHAVLFSRAVERDLPRFFELIDRANEMAAESRSGLQPYRIEYSFFGYQSDAEARDGDSGSLLIKADIANHPYMFTIVTPTAKDLEEWYKASAHSGLRRDFYCLVSQTAEDLFSEYDAVAETVGDLNDVLKRKRQIFERIERLATKHIVRVDYRFEEGMRDTLIRSVPREQHSSGASQSSFSLPGKT